MSEELVADDVIEGEVAASPEQRRSSIYSHPKRREIEHLLRVGKSADWIQYWLEDEYPLVDEDEEGEECAHEHAVQHERWRIAASTIGEYRSKFMPECEPGISVVDDELEDLIGRRFPGAQRWELDVMETGVRVSQHTLLRSMQQDEDMKMVTPTTMDANERMMNAAAKLLDVKARLGLPGYEAAPEHIITENTHSSLSVALHGRVDKNGQVLPGDAKKVEAVVALLQLSSDERTRVLEAARPDGDDDPADRPAPSQNGGNAHVGE